MDTIGTFEAKTHFSQLMERVTRGEEIIVTKRGKAIAKIMPINTKYDPETAQATVRRIVMLSQELKLDNCFKNEWKSDRDHGRA